MANLKIELSKFESEAWPGVLDIEKEKLMLINEKEELLKELQFVTPCKCTQDELEHLETERKRLEEELSVKSTPTDELTERYFFLFLVMRKCLQMFFSHTKHNIILSCLPLVDFFLNRLIYYHHLSSWAAAAALYKLAIYVI
uniref:WWC1-like helical hairpin domain-containing protein n=1 Tax=Varanus komodoensis TaxID=61221 RepID=A0A8D2IWG7_VARKO